MLSAAKVEGTRQTVLSNGGRMLITIKSGKDLVVRDRGMFLKGSSDPFVIIKSGGEREVGRTEVVKKSLNPQWENATFTFDVSSKEKPLVVIEIWDEDKSSQNDPMGVVTLPLSSLVDVENHAMDHEFPVEQCKGATEKDLGTLHVRAVFDPIASLALAAGQVTPLEQTRFAIGLGWDFVGLKKPRHDQAGKKQVDLDASAVVFSAQGRLLEAVYFDQLQSTKISGERAIVHSGDARTGDDVIGGDDETIHIDLNKLQPDVLAVFISICAFTDNTTFEDVKSAHCRITSADSGIEYTSFRLGNMGPRTAVTVCRLYRDASSSKTGWSMVTIAATDSIARSWGYLVPQMKDLLGADLVPGCKGFKHDRIAILSKGQSFKISDTCDSMPDVWCLGLHWDVTNGVNIDLDASIAVLDETLRVTDCVSFSKLVSSDHAIRHMGDEQEGDEEGDDEQIVIDLGLLNAQASYLCVVINSYSGQELDDVDAAGCHLFDMGTRREVCKINMTGEKSMDGKTASFVCCLFKVGSEWWLKNVNQGMLGNNVASTLGAIKTWLSDEQLIVCKQSELEVQRKAAASFAADRVRGFKTGRTAMSAFSGGMGVSSPVSASRDRHGSASVATTVTTVGGVGVVGVGMNGGGGPGDDLSILRARFPQMDEVVLRDVYGQTGQNVEDATSALAAALAETEDSGAVDSVVNFGSGVGSAAMGVGNGASGAIYSGGEAVVGRGIDPRRAAEAAAAAAAREVMGGLDLTAIDTDIALSSIAALGQLASAIPIVGGLCPLMTSIVDGSRAARYNKLAARALADRVRELALALHDLLKAVTEISPSLEAELNRLTPLLEQAREYVTKFAKRSYLGRILSGYSDAENLQLLDKSLTDVLQSISLSLGAAQLQLQAKTFEKLDQLAALVKMTRGGANGDGSDGGNGNALTTDSPVVQAIAQCVGVDVREVVGQLQFSLDEVLSSQKTIEAKLDTALARLGSIDDGNTNAFADCKLPPEDPRTFWDGYFGTEKVVPADQFIPVFEEEFCPEDVELTEEERTAMLGVLDAYPCDGCVSIVEWKRFCKQCTKSERSLYGFVHQLVRT